MTPSPFTVLALILLQILSTEWLLAAVRFYLIRLVIPLDKELLFRNRSSRSPGLTFMRSERVSQCGQGSPVRWQRGALQAPAAPLEPAQWGRSREEAGGACCCCLEGKQRARLMEAHCSYLEPGGVWERPELLFWGPSPRAQ